MGKKKGEYGYRDSKKNIRFLITAVLAAAVLAQLAARSLTDNQAARNILTVMAILTVLPMANVASPLLASWKYRTPPEEFWARVRAYEGKCVILYDLILTTKEYVIPVDAAAVHPSGIFACCTSSKLDIGRAEKALNSLFAAGGHKLHVRLFWDERSFFKRLDILKPMERCADDESVEAAASFLETLSM